MKRNQILPVPYDSHPGLPLDPDVVKPGQYKWPPHFTPALQGLVFAGGCLGTLARYGIISAVPSSNGSWPLDTFITNMLGSFILGLLLQALFHLGKDEANLRVLRLCIGTGFIGAFTTYSSLAIEADLLIKNNHTLIAVFYALSSVLGGVIACAMGIEIASWRTAKRGGKI